MVQRGEAVLLAGLLHIIQLITVKPAMAGDSTLFAREDYVEQRLSPDITIAMGMMNLLPGVAHCRTRAGSGLRSNARVLTDRVRRLVALQNGRLKGAPSD
jgi:hypothetical protein